MCAHALVVFTSRMLMADVHCLPSTQWETARGREHTCPNPENPANLQGEIPPVFAPTGWPGPTMARKVKFRLCNCCRPHSFYGRGRS